MPPVPANRHGSPAGKVSGEFRIKPRLRRFHPSDARMCDCSLYPCTTIGRRARRGTAATQDGRRRSRRLPAHAALPPTSSISTLHPGFPGLDEPSAYSAQVDAMTSAQCARLRGSSSELSAGEPRPSRAESIHAANAASSAMVTASGILRSSEASSSSACLSAASPACLPALNDLSTLLRVREAEFEAGEQFRKRVGVHLAECQILDADTEVDVAPQRVDLGG